MKAWRYKLRTNTDNECILFYSVITFQLFHKWRHEGINCIQIQTMSIFLFIRWLIFSLSINEGMKGWTANKYKQRVCSFLFGDYFSAFPSIKAWRNKLRTNTNNECILFYSATTFQLFRKWRHERIKCEQMQTTSVFFFIRWLLFSFSINEGMKE